MASIGEAVMQRWFTPNFHETRAEELFGYRLMLERQPAEGYSQTCAAIRDSDVAAVAKTITVPVLVLAGDEDGAAPAEMVEAAAATIPGARFELIEGCGHIPCVEQPERLAALIDGFMRKS
jgi:3-oxoadipate enol-lactonase